MAIREMEREWNACQLDFVKRFLLHYESDVKDLPICCVGSIAEVAETGNVYVLSSDKTWVLRDTAIGTGGMGGADWNQNNPGAPDYVKGRTHWSEYTVSDTALYGPSTLETTVKDGYTVAHVYEGPSLDRSIGLVRVVFDGEVYITKCVTMNNGYGIGNLSIIEASGVKPECYPYGVEYDDTGEPFCFVDSQYYSPAKHFFSKNAGEHTVEMFVVIETITQIDMKYMPDSLSHIAQNYDAAIASKMNVVNPQSSGIFSHGRNSVSTTGKHSIALGQNCEASGTYSVAIGNTAKATTTYALAIGELAEATGGGAVAIGNYTVAASTDQFVAGIKNIKDSTGKYAIIFGNAKSGVARSNGFTMDWSGVPWFKGRPQFGGTAQDNGSQTVMANGDTEIILASSTADSTKKFKITVDDTGTLTATEVTE